MTVLIVLLRFIVEMYAVFGVLFFLLTLPNPFKRGIRWSDTEARAA